MARFESAMWIVAINALYKALVDAMVEGSGECLLQLEVAGVTKLRLFLPHEVLGFLRIVWIVAIGAADIVLKVGGASEIRMLGAILVAAQAASADLFGRRVLKREDLGLVTPAFHMLLAGTMASLATVPFGPVLRVERRGEVW